MFAIYDIGGRNFSGTLERLRKVRKSRPAPEAVFFHGSANKPAHHQFTSRSVSARACQAYREKLQIEDRVAVVHAHQIMSQPVETVNMTLDIVSTCNLFREQRRHQQPVVDARQRIVGMLTERDLLQFLITNNDQVRYLHEKTVADAMSAQVITADPISDIRRIAKAMLDYRLSAVPIVDTQDQLIGLVSRSDILRAATLDPPLSLWT